MWPSCDPVQRRFFDLFFGLHLDIFHREMNEFSAKPGKT